MELDYKNLRTKYPLLFQSADSREPFAMFGFECGIGWYHIIDNACWLMYSDYLQAKRQFDYFTECLTELPEYIARSWQTDLTDEQITKDLVETIERYRLETEAAIIKLPKVAQIKEKFGTLRLYVNSCVDDTNTITNYAELMSCVTCEVCGNLGKTYHMGWHKTLCEQHAIENYGKENVDECNKEPLQ